MAQPFPRAIQDMYLRPTLEQSAHVLRVQRIQPLEKKDIVVAANVSDISITSTQNITIEGEKNVTVSSDVITLAGTTTFGSDAMSSLTIQMLSSCNSCLDGGCYGFAWPNPNSVTKNSSSTLELCMNCIYASALHYQAKQNWDSVNGDANSNLRKEIQVLREQVNKLITSQQTNSKSTII